MLELVVPFPLKKTPNKLDYGIQVWFLQSNQNNFQINKKRKRYNKKIKKWIDWLFF